VLYDRVLATGLMGAPIADKDGKPVLKRMALTKEEASTVNIAPLTSTVPGADIPECPMPLVACDQDEELFFYMGGLGQVMVRNIPLWQALQGAGAGGDGFAAADRAMLKSIYAKVMLT